MTKHINSNLILNWGVGERLGLWSRREEEVELGMGLVQVGVRSGYREKINRGGRCGHHGRLE